MSVGREDRFYGMSRMRENFIEQNYTIASDAVGLFYSDKLNSNDNGGPKLSVEGLEKKLKALRRSEEHPILSRFGEIPLLNLERHGITVLSTHSDGIGGKYDRRELDRITESEDPEESAADEADFVEYLAEHME